MNAVMLAISAVYSICGVCTSIYLYGRKTDHLEDYWKEREESDCDTK